MFSDFNKSPELCSHHHSSVLEHSHHPREVPWYPFCLHSPFSTPSPATNLLSVSLALPLLHIPYRCSHRARGLLCLASFVSMKRRGHRVAARLSRGAEWRSGVWVHHVWFIHSLVGGHLDCLVFPTTLIKTAAVNIHTQIFLCLCFYLSWVCP